MNNIKEIEAEINKLQKNSFVDRTIGIVGLISMFGFAVSVITLAFQVNSKLATIAVVTYVAYKSLAWVARRDFTARQLKAQKLIYEYAVGSAEQQMFGMAPGTSDETPKVNH